MQATRLKSLFLSISLLIIILNSNFGFSQNLVNDSTILKGLKLAGPGDLQPGTPLMLNPMITPIYNDSLRKINADEFSMLMMTNEYVPEPYIDENKSVKAFVLRKATSEEKEMMAKYLQEGLKESMLTGTQANDFKLTDLKGKKYNLSDFKGKVVLLNFWFVECKPCVMEMPELNDLVKEFKDKDVVFLGIALNDEKALKNFLKKNDFEFKLFPNGSFVIETYGVKSFPTNIIIDQNGMIQFVSSGVGPNNKSNLEREITSLLKN
jgi:peroxiredoxin